MLGLCLFQVSLTVISLILLYVVTLYSLAKRPTRDNNDYIGLRTEIMTTE